MFERKGATAFLTLAILLASSKASVGPTANLIVANRDIQPDGFTRSTVLVNGVYPAPLIAANEGDHFRLNVTDLLTDTTMEVATTIHWHGLFQKGTTYDDGVAFVSQCPIVPGNSFLYSFSAPGQAGTFWYHSHLTTQYCDGLRGPLVIYDPYDPHASLYDIDDESTVITLSDWYHIPAPEDGLFPIPDSTLINGLGRYSGNITSPLAVVSVKARKRYRLRIVAIACHPQWDFSIDGHNFTVIEADGIETDPLPVDSLTILAGQRYSVVLNTNQAVDNYWIRANPNMGDTGFVDGINSAILRYDGAAEIEPTSNQTASVAPLVETELHALNTKVPGKHVPGGADVNMNLIVGLTSDNHFTINNVSYVPPPVPVLLQVLNGANATDLMPTGSVYSLPANKVVELSFSGTAAGGPHPFHLHGHAFDVVRSAGNTSYNFVNPVRRDVVSIGGATGLDNTTIRFTTDNAGPWILHCHIDWHFNLGFAIVFAEDIPDIAKDNVVTPAWKDLCPAYNALINSNSSSS